MPLLVWGLVRMCWLAALIYRSPYQPLSVEGQIGLNIALGVSGLTLVEFDSSEKRMAE